MEGWFIFGGIALCLFSLWALLSRDWVRLRQMPREVEGEVIGHRINTDGDGTTFAAIYRFGAEGAVHEVIDQVYSSTRQPPEGTRVSLRYPFGRPDLARPPRPWLWVWVYAIILWLLGMLVAKAMGWLG